MLQWLKAIQTANDYSNLITALATVFIAALTIVLAITGACQADIAKKALEINVRPYIDINAIGGSMRILPEKKIHIVIEMKNFGGTPADVKIKAVVLYSTTKLRSPSTSGGLDDLHTIFPKDTPASTFIYSVNPVTDGQLNDIKAGTGFIYIRVLGTYGPYHREICNELPLRPVPNPGANFAIDVKEIARCEDPSANSAN